MKVPHGITEPAPLVIVLHWGNGDAKGMKQATGYNDLCARDKAIVVYGQGVPFSRPSGVWRGWNADGCCGEAAADNVDDMFYLDTLIEAMLATGAVDPDRVHLVGSSQGGMMAYRYIAERPGVIASVASFSGLPTIAAFPDPQMMNVFHWHGTQDELVPIDGGYSEKLGAAFMSFDDLDQYADPESGYDHWPSPNGASYVDRWTGRVQVVTREFWQAGHGGFPDSQWERAWDWSMLRRRPQ